MAIAGASAFIAWAAGDSLGTPRQVRYFTSVPFQINFRHEKILPDNNR